MWIGVSLILCFRAIVWLEPFELSTKLLLETVSLLLAIVGYAYGFSKFVQKNIAHIHALPDKVNAFAFTAWRGYFMIGLMVTLGITLRNSSIPKYILSVPYTVMGGMLFIGSQRFIGQFLKVKLQNK